LPRRRLAPATVLAPAPPLFLLFAASVIVGAIPIVVMILQPTRLMMGVALAVSLGLTAGILATLLRYLDA